MGLFSAAQNYIQNEGTINLYPKYLEEHGYLDKSFGYQAGKANNWTKNGGWIGKWPCPDGKGECFGVGIVADIDTLKPIIDRYKSKALQIFFPYPKIYNENSEDTKDINGQLLIIFKAPKPKPIISQIPYTIDFKTNGNAKRFELSGFCGSENWGTWSCAKEVRMEFDFNHYNKKPLFLKLDFSALAAPSHPQTFYFYLNGVLLKQLTLTNNTENQVVFDISKIVKARNILVIKIPNATTPKSLGINADTRLLGIGLIKLTLTGRKN